MQRRKASIKIAQLPSVILVCLGTLQASIASAKPEPELSTFKNLPL